jgi:hypothetical protein
MKSSRGAVLMVGGDEAPLVIVVVGIVLFAGTEFGCGCACGSGSGSGAGSVGFAEVMVVAEVGVIGGTVMLGAASVDDDTGVCGVDKTAIVVPNKIIPTTATTQVITARTLRRGTITVGLSCGFVSSRLDDGGAASLTAASRPE